VGSAALGCRSWPVRGGGPWAHFVTAHTSCARRCCSDLLEEVLLALSNADGQAGGLVDRARMFRAIREGVEHFVQFLDPSSFYGLVPATVPALILQAAKVEGGKGVPWHSHCDESVLEHACTANTSAAAMHVHFVAHTCVVCGVDPLVSLAASMGREGAGAVAVDRQPLLHVSRVCDLLLLGYADARQPESCHHRTPVGSSAR
jgi:hypothetical protein